MSQYTKDIAINLIGIALDKIEDIEIRPSREEKDEIVGYLYEAMRKISDWNEGI